MGRRVGGQGDGRDLRMGGQADRLEDWQTNGGGSPTVRRTDSETEDGRGWGSGVTGGSSGRRGDGRTDGRR